jgi:hypothetical protein
VGRAVSKVSALVSLSRFPAQRMPRARKAMLLPRAISPPTTRALRTLAPVIKVQPVPMDRAAVRIRVARTNKRAWHAVRPRNKAAPGAVSPGPLYDADGELTCGSCGLFRFDGLAPQRPDLRVQVPTGHTHEIGVGAKSRRLAEVAAIRSVNVKAPKSKAYCRSSRSPSRLSISV